MFLQHGFPVDRDPRGKEKLKTAGISQENQQGAKNLTSRAEIARRTNHIKKIHAKQNRKEDSDKVKLDQKVDQERARLTKLCSLLDGLSESNIELLATPEVDCRVMIARIQNCTLEHFATLNLPDLKEFITARHETLKTPSSVKFKKPQGKGKALAEVRKGIKNLVFVAHQLRTKKSRLLEAAAAFEKEIIE